MVDSLDPRISCLNNSGPTYGACTVYLPQEQAMPPLRAGQVEAVLRCLWKDLGVRCPHIRVLEVFGKTSGREQGQAKPQEWGVEAHFSCATTFWHGTPGLQEL